MPPRRRRGVSQRTSSSVVPPAVEAENLRDFIARVSARAASVSAFVKDARSRHPGRAAATADEMAQRDLLDASLEELRVVEEELRDELKAMVQARALVDAERTRYRMFFDDAGDPCFVTDANGSIVEANKAAGLAFHTRVSDMEGHPMTSFVARGDCARFRRLLSELPQRPLVEAFELRMRPRPPKTGMAMRLSASVLRDAKGTVCVRWIARPGSVSAGAQAPNDP